MSDGDMAGRPPAAVHEQAFYFTSAGRRLFAVLHAPPDPAASRGGWLLCAPFGEERGFAQRTCVEWARALAAAGHWVLRFDVRGYGDSEGLFEEFTPDDHVEDVLAARQELERRAGVRCQGLWGLRLGATLATLAAARGGLEVALALWEPVVSGERYMDGLLRAVMVKEMTNTGRAPRTRDQLRENLAAGGQVIVEGHPLTDAIHRSIAAIDLAAPGAAVHGPAFVAQISARAETKPRRELEKLRAALGDASLELVQAPPPWQQNDEYSGTVRPAALFEATLRWIAQLPAPAALPVHSAPEPLAREWRTADGALERAVSIPAAGGTLRGILHLPAAVDRSRPAVLMVTPGFNCRTARYRLYVRLARELARRGWVALRPDPHGIGDSDGVLDHASVPDLYNAIEDGVFVEDTRAALAFLESELGVGSALLVGLCGGANTSVRVGALDPRVAGIVASELPFLFTPHIGAEETAAPVPVAKAAADHFLRSYVRKLLDPEAWRRFFSMKSDYRSLLASLKVALVRRLWPRRVAADDAWFQERLGPRANLGLVGAFRGCLARRIPVLCLFGATRNSWYFSELWPGFRASAPGAEARVSTKSIQDADPGFSLPEHAREFLDTVLGWADARDRDRAEAPGRAQRSA
ncbi:alpha/beta hydrolase [Anaeromyxobacter sp. Red801]|uniref:alpha/beta hydrolase n=1 Tax=Anaeromyxobacter sp. Red801 TaxID=3411632 RepID=UPI003B9EBEF0